MHEAFVDRICAGLPDAERRQPFGPETAVWTVDGHMFAAYTTGGRGLSLRLTGPKTAGKLVREGRALTAPDLESDGWVLIPWETPPEEIQDRLERSYRLVRTDGNARSTGGGRSNRGRPG